MTATSPSNSPARTRLMLWSTGAFVLAALLYGAWWLLFAAHYESTDDAYVHGNLVQVSAQIPGTVVAIDAEETQEVSQGARLVTLDDSDTGLALAQAEAALAQTVRHTQTLFVQNDALAADVAVGEANVAQAETQLSKARNDLQRRNALRGTGGVSGEELLHAQVAVKSAEASLAQARAGLAAARAKLATNQALTRGSSVATHPDVLQAADQVRQAWLASVRAQVLAPVGGMVAQRSVQLGQRIQPGAPLMTIVPLDSLWVEANFKENQLDAMRPGQKATLISDLYGSKTVYHGTVVGVAAGSGSAFALLPAQNASGNWIKVIQRVPVRIRLDPKELQAHPLRVGLSMTVEVDLSSTPEQADGNGQDNGARATGPALSTPVYDHDATEIDARIRQIIQDNIGAAGEPGHEGGNSSGAAARNAKETQ
ncbi:HlyD family efflux transporter periplasmic adaptor subunit [Castellaniella daejeonensis]|jgi:membrane fusion protein (multidrug efflux system)|uniref:HlyD family efflux transporter periplasmic adaptor subunit n=1 Tax=Castellaniella daejeonensis TaxID=659013 RepID=A0ABP3D520_9BURK|nr:HlyD family efflux transporter periplasmic adaptor subunit [Castellaniella sp.]HET8702254.1 HlyD family efflux transporter periplasmic adaptor subunit [Castellaniella sp.]